MQYTNEELTSYYVGLANCLKTVVSTRPLADHVDRVDHNQRWTRSHQAYLDEARDRFFRSITDENVPFM